MNLSRAANRYAKAVLDLAVEKDQATAVNEDMKSVVSTISSSKDLRQFLSSPLIKAEQKKSALTGIFKDVNSITEGSFDLLIKNNRIDILSDVAMRYIFLFEEMNRREIATVTTAVPLEGELENKILAKAKQLAGKEVSLNKQIDKSIIGGFILRVGDQQVNASVQSKLNELKREFTN